MTTLPIRTQDGVFLATFTGQGLARLDFPVAGRRPAAVVPATGLLRRWHRATERAVTRILSGRKAPAGPPLDLSAGTDFQRAVWAVLRRVPAGSTRDYAEIAAAVGRPKAARAVGQACGANPVPLLVPCHRVVAAGGRLGGFSSGTGWKEKLLLREGWRGATSP